MTTSHERHWSAVVLTGRPKFGSHRLDPADGGRGHVSACLPWRTISLPLAGVVKDRHRTRGLVLSSGQTIELASSSVPEDELARETEEERARRQGLLHLLTAVQDEAHRFARRLNEQRRHQAAKRYHLETIPGIGPARRKALLKAFGSSKKISEASLDELAGVPGLPQQAALAVWQHFHGNEPPGGDDK